MSIQPSDFTRNEPSSVPQTRHQLGILVLEGSGSMNEPIEGKRTKAQIVDQAVKDLLNQLIMSKNNQDFSISLVSFDEHCRVHTFPTRVTDKKGRKIEADADYDPTQGHGGGSDIAQALKEAHVLAEEFLSGAKAKEVPHSVVIVLMSNGVSQTDPLPVANYIKENPNITLCSSLFTSKEETHPAIDQARDILEQIATSPEHYVEVHDGEALKDFFIDSVTR
ncbi:MAG: VWA domain-containing protein [Candidatus Binatia bacterium]